MNGCTLAVFFAPGDSEDGEPGYEWAVSRGGHMVDWSPRERRYQTPAAAQRACTRAGRKFIDRLSQVGGEMNR